MLCNLLDQIKEARTKIRSARPVLVGIDGQSGAGKSTLARRIQEALGSALVVHKDDFYSSSPEAALMGLTPSEGYLRYFEWQRLLEQVLLPLSSGESATYQRYDWSQRALGGWSSIPASCDFVVIEGVYALRPELRQSYDIKILVKTNEDIRTSRLIARGENTSDWIRRWSAAENLYFERVFVADGVCIIEGENA